MLELLSLAGKKMVHEIPTRWLGRHLMLKRLFDVWEQVAAVLTTRAGVKATEAAAASAMTRSPEAVLAGKLADVMSSEVHDLLALVLAAFEPLAQWAVGAQSELLVGGPLVFLLRELHDKLTVQARELWPAELTPIAQVVQATLSKTAMHPEDRALEQARAFEQLLRPPPRACTTPADGSEAREDDAPHKALVCRAVSGEVARALKVGLEEYYIFPAHAMFGVDDALLAIDPTTRPYVAHCEEQRARSREALMRLAYLLDLPDAPPEPAHAAHGASAS